MAPETPEPTPRTPGGGRVIGFTRSPGGTLRSPGGTVYGVVTTGTNPPAATASTNPPPPVAPTVVASTGPRRGGIHPTYGIYIGGSPLADDYTQVDPRTSFKFQTQRRDVKTAPSVERSLNEARDSTTVVKFAGNIDIKAGANELDKEAFIRTIRTLVRQHGHESFYAIKDDSGTVVDLLKNLPNFNLNKVQAEFERRIASTNTSIEAFDEMELADIQLSRLVVRSRITAEFARKVEVRYGVNNVDFETYSGAVYLMQVLETCHASTGRDVAQAKKDLDALELSSFPGEDVTELATKAKSLIEIMSNDFALPIDQGSKLLMKVTKTSSDMFNRAVFAKLDEVRKFEQQYRLLNPEKIKTDKQYATLGPLAIIAWMINEHGSLIQDDVDGHLWPALTATKPSVNTVVTSNVSSTKPAPDKKDGEWTLVQKKKGKDGEINESQTKRNRGRRGRTGDTNNKNKPKGKENVSKPPGDAKPRERKPLDAWKYIAPADPTQTLTDGGKTWKYCALCTCRATQKKGFWNLSHTTAEHKADWRPSQPAGNHVNAPPAGPSPVDGWHLSGIWCAPIADPSPGVWCAPGPPLSTPTSTVVVRPVEREKSVVDVHQDNDTAVTPLVHRNNVWGCLTRLVLTFVLPFILWTLFAPWNIVSAAATAVIEWPRLMWHNLFFVSALIWDTVAYLVTAPAVPNVPRRYRRSRNKFVRAIVASPLFFWSLAITPQPVMLPKGAHILLSEAPSSWLIVDNVVQFAAGSRPHPLAFVRDAHRRVAGTYRRIGALDDLVELNASTFWQYQQLRWREFYPSYSVEVDGDDADFFDTVETEETFCETFVDGMFYFDANEQTPELTDPFCFDNLVECPNAVHACFASPETIFAQPSVYNTMPSTPHDFVAEPSSFMCFGAERGRVSIILDTGASLAITPSADDFIGPITVPPGERRLGGMAQGMPIEGVGTVCWTFTAEDGSDLEIATQAYLVPQAQQRLLSPQRLFHRENGVAGKFEGDDKQFILTFFGCPRLIVDYEPTSSLPIAYARTGAAKPQVNLSLSADGNQNLTAAQRLLLLMHAKFGHLNLAAVQTVLRKAPFLSTRYQNASKCDILGLRCEICELAKATRRPTQGTTERTDPVADGTISADHLRPGSRVSCDHFESRLRGRTYDSFGRPTSKTYVGGLILVDAASKYLHVEMQVGFTAAETIRAKQAYEKFAMDNGVVVQSYLTDNGVFKANQLVQHVRDTEQQLRFCGVNAHHQNGAAERAIRTVSNIARAMLLHASAHWKGGIDSTLWPMAVHHAAYLYNHTPDATGICPADIFMGTTVPRHRLQDLHVWGCPAFVLDPVLQQGKKLPRWQPKSRKCTFLGFSKDHSSNVPLVLNPMTGSITPQYHVVFDDLFSTVASIEREEEPPDHWEQLCLDSFIFVPTEANEPANQFLSDEWLTPEEQAAKRRTLDRAERIRDRLQPPAAPEVPTPSTTRLVPTRATTRLIAESTVPPPTAPPPAPPTTTTTTTGRSEGAAPPDPTVAPPTVSTPVPPRSPQQPTPTTPSAATPVVDNTLRRRRDGIDPANILATKRVPKPKILSYFTRVHVPTVLHADSHEQRLAYLAAVHTDYETGELDTLDPRVYAARSKQNDPDMPNFNQAVYGEHADEWLEAMREEVSKLLKAKTWETVPRPADKNVIKSTWAFKLKRLPDGTPYRFKARFCVRGDMQKQDLDYFETYAPVVQWSTIRLLLTTVLQNGWKTRQVDYTNAFAQAELSETVFVEPPRLFSYGTGLDVVLKLIKSLYGLKQAPRTFFEKLRDGLVERGYHQSDHDPCLFLKKNIMCVVYVDDTIFAGPDAGELEREIRSLGIDDGEKRHTFELRNEGEVANFLGVHIAKLGDGRFHLTQTGLIDKVLKAIGGERLNGCDTPATPVPLVADTHGEPFSETWDYASVVGMLMYLAQNSRPDLAYAVHSAARFTHAPRASHAAAVKRIARYLRKTRDYGLYLQPDSTYKVDTYVDSDFGGLFASEDRDNPVSVKSRTGYVIFYSGCPILWVSKLQTQIALSTMEAEYIALSQSMRDLIPIREILKEMFQHVFDKKPPVRYTTKSRIFEVPPSTVYEDNAACLQFARMPRMTPRTKHIGIPYHWFREKVDSLEIAIEPIKTSEQLADQFTKGLVRDKFVAARKPLMGW